MELQLRYEPKPENAAKFAADIVASAAEVSGVTLDYGVASLAVVDGIMEALRADGVRVDQVAETLFGFGCYVGEVLVRNSDMGAAWQAPNAKELEWFGWPMIVKASEDNVCNPIGKAFKRFENGQEDSLAYFYGVFSRAGRSAESETSESAESAESTEGPGGSDDGTGRDSA
jgi:hypothetical protein